MVIKSNKKKKTSTSDSRTLYRENQYCSVHIITENGD